MPRESLRAVLEEHASREVGASRPSAAELEVYRLQSKLRKLREQLATVQCRMAIELNDDQYQALGTEFDRIRAEVTEIEKRLETQRRESSAGPRATAEEEVEAAMAVFDDITRKTTDEQALGEINPLLARLGM